MKSFINEATDIKWLNETHLKGVTLPSKYKAFQSAIISGNEDCPDSVDLYVSTDPLIDENYLRVIFIRDVIYCEYFEHSGETQQPL